MSKKRDYFLTGVLIALVVFVVVIVVLTLMGPAVGNISSSLASSLGGDIDGGGNYPPPAPRKEVAVKPTAVPVSTTDSAAPTDMFFEDYGVNPMLDTADDHLSTFAMDVDTGSYTIARSYLTGYDELPPADAIRPEEFINYFDAHYESPPANDAFAIHLDAAPAPFGYNNHYLLRVGIQGRYIAPQDRNSALLIFVIDVSGSMDMENRLGLVKEALALLVGELREDDRVGIIVYSDNSRPVLEPIPASEKDTIMAAINHLRPEGSTNAEAGLRLGYVMAQRAMREGQITRIVLCSDGVANVGNTGPDSILNTVRDGVEDGITLSTIGFGMSNYNDTLMEQLANDGNGNYFYIDNLREARRVFVHNLTGTLQVIAYDAKIQVDFDPTVTDRYRLIGYENRAIADEDFRDDTVDAGEIGAGHSITALYELALDDDAVVSGTMATVYIRYQDAETKEIVEVNRSISTDDIIPLGNTPPDFRLLAAAAEFSEILRESYWAQEGNYGAILTLLDPLEFELVYDTQVAELRDLVLAAIRLGDK
jgi:Ca-activated chloride channel homolog